MCGKIRFTLKGPLDGMYFCHCRMCRKNYGMYGAFVGVLRKNFSLKGTAYLRWYRSSSKAKRAFCRQCGSPVVWDYAESSNIYVLPGLIEGKTGLKKTKKVFFLKEKGDYYKITKS